MKILVTGAAGFIGGHLSTKLTEMGHEVIGIDNFFHPSKNPNNNKVVKLDIGIPSSQKFSYFNQEFSGLSELIKWADVVFHLAAQIHVDYSIQHPKETFQMNVDNTLRVLLLCRQHNKKLVFASSSEIYGTHETIISENSVCTPQSPYAVSKLTGDQLCTLFRDLYGMKINVVRNFNTFGIYQNDTSYGGVIAIFTRKALANEPIEIFGDGDQERDYMYYTDALKAYELALDKDFSIPVNFGSGKTVSINYLAQLIKSLAGSSSEIKHIEARPNEVRKLQADISLAKTLGFTPSTDFEHNLATYINWYKNK